MSCDEIVCIENVVDIQATYCIINLSLSDLIDEILQEAKKGFIQILELRILLQSLKFVPFTEERKGEQLLSELIEHIEDQTEWNITYIVKKVVLLQQLILWDYIINGSLIIYHNNEIKWDIDVAFILNQGEVELYRLTNNKEAIL